MAQTQTDHKAYYNIDNPSTNDPTHEELRPLNQIYDEISQEEPPSPHLQILTEAAVVTKVDLGDMGLKIKAILAIFALLVVVLIAVVSLLYIFHGKKTFSDAQYLNVFTRRIDDFVKGWFSIYGGSG